MSPNLNVAVQETKGRLAAGCIASFDTLMDQLLKVGQGDPKPENKRMFSEFLQWSSDQGIISPLKAKQTYTRYFGTKFVSALSNYSTCSAYCPIEAEVLANMRQELLAKDMGLMQVTGDTSGYQRANQLFGEMEITLSAICSSCAAVN